MTAGFPGLDDKNEENKKGHVGMACFYKKSNEQTVTGMRFSFIS